MLSRRVFLSFLSGAPFAIASLMFCGWLSACKPRKRPTVPKAISLGTLKAINQGSNPLEFYRVFIQREDRDDGVHLRAVSMVCTHDTCLLTRAAEGFNCPCHGAQFNSVGKVVLGPAEEDLPWYELSLSNSGTLILDRTKRVAATSSLVVPYSMWTEDHHGSG